MCFCWLRRTSTSILHNELVRQTALNRWINRYTLEKEKCLSWVISDWWNAMVQSRDEVRTDLINWTECFEGNGKEMVIFLAFGRRFSCWCCTGRWYAQVRATLSVTVTSHVAQRPSPHGMRVCCQTLEGHVVLWWMANPPWIRRAISSLIKWRRCWERPGFRLQDNGIYKCRLMHHRRNVTALWQLSAAYRKIVFESNGNSEVIRCVKRTEVRVLPNKIWRECMSVLGRNKL